MLLMHQMEVLIAPAITHASLNNVNEEKVWILSSLKDIIANTYSIIHLLYKYIKMF